MHFERPNLTLIIDRRLYRAQGEGMPPLSLVEAAIEGGITMLQLRLGREPSGPLGGAGGGEDLAAYAIAQRLREMTEGRVPFLITADLELADRSRADGVLLVGERSYRPSDAKEYLSGGSLVGYYAETVPGAAKAERGGADFVQVGPVFDTDILDAVPSESALPHNDAEPLALIRKIKDAINLPIVALGGVDTPERAAAAIDAGADGIAVAQAILAASDPRAATEALRRAIGG